MSDYIDPSVDDFKAYFVRDFPYAPDPYDDLSMVIPSDINNALLDAKVFFNPDLASDQDSYTLYFLLLTAHFLVTNLRNSSQGLAGSYKFLATSTSVGSVSESTTLPERIQNNPELMMLSKTNYGAKFLQLVLPQLVGQIFTVCGATRP